MVWQIMGACRRGNFVLQAPLGAPTVIAECAATDINSDITAPWGHLTAFLTILLLARCRRTTSIRVTCRNWPHP